MSAATDRAVRRAVFQRTAATERTRRLLQSLTTREPNGADSEIATSLARMAWSADGSLLHLSRRVDRRFAEAAINNPSLPLGRTLATLVHGRLADAYEAGRRDRGASAANPAVEATISAFESAHRERLRALRLAAIVGDPERISNHLERWLDLGPFEQALYQAARWSDDLQLSPVAPGLRASHAARRHALLVAGAVRIAERLASEKRATTAEVVRRRSSLERLELRPKLARRGLARAIGTRQRLLGRLDGIDYVGGEKPYGRADLTSATGSPTVVKLPWKSFLRRGIAPGSMFYAIGKVAETSMLGRHLEIEQEGPSEHASTVFEDWLAVEARAAYDLYPGGLRAFWEFPPHGAQAARLDFLGRSERAERSEVAL